VLGAFAVATLGYSHWRFLDDAGKQAEEGARAEMARQLDQLQAQLEHLARKGEPSRIREVLAATGADPALTTALLAGPDGTIRAAHRQAWVGRNMAGILASRPPVRGLSESGITLTGTSLHGAYPVILDRAPDDLTPTGIGELHLIRSLEGPLAAARAAARSQTAHLSLFLLVVVAGLVLVLHRQVGQRMNRLTAAADHFAGGDTSARAALAGRDELATISRAFDAMAERVASTHAALDAERERAQVTLHSIGDAVITTDAEGRVEYLNPVAETLTGWSAGEAAGRELGEVFRIFNEQTGEPADNPVQRCLGSGTVVGLANHTALESRDGRVIAIEDSAAPIRDEQGRIVGAVMVFHDVSEKRALTQQLSWQASHDPLTGLVNRREFERHLEALLEDARASGRHHALLFLDLDQFKLVNDTAGHAAGDELLRQLPRALREHLRSQDLLARLGGDEFALLLQDADLAAASRVAEKIRTAVEEYRFHWQGHPFQVGASIGVALVEPDSHDVHEILSAADVAAYTAKDLGRNRVHVWQHHDDAVRQRQGEMHIVTVLSEALDRDLFRLVSQPIHHFRDHGLDRHEELLVRLVHPTSGEVLMPDRFIPAAERYGVMPSLDRWVIRHAFAALAAPLRASRDAQGRDAGGRPTWLFNINLSGASLGDGELLAWIREQAREHDLPPAGICFEITETAAVANLLETRHFIHELRRDGFQFALDDFGSGLSSFAYLKELEVDWLKIDGHFIRELLTDPVDRALVEAIHGVGRVIGLHTIAEAAETGEQVTALADIGVDAVQGFGVAMARGLEESLAPTG
jgi:diguanylate cyclase (GGDEF)-like protein/PAS domain S-box-containing protein